MDTATGVHALVDVEYQKRSFAGQRSRSLDPPNMDAETTTRA